MPFAPRAIAAIALLTVCAAGCEFFRGTRREVPVTAVSTDCVRQALARVPEISSVREGSAQSVDYFNWEARRGALRTQGIVRLPRGPEKRVLALEAGFTYACNPDSLRYAKAMLDAIYKELQASCEGVPDASVVHEEDIKGCG